jgi:tRNA-(ms[2]io[6]A)-hydroxylase
MYVCSMFRLQLPTDPRWADIASMQEQDILTDHAWCEQKAASTAISMMVHYSDFPQIVSAMSVLAAEEISHFQRVFSVIQSRGYVLGPERKDPYVGALLGFTQKGGEKRLRMVDHLLMAALIEARSCERFRLLSEQHPDPELAAFYRELMESEAAHYTTFITLARDVAPRTYVDQRWAEWLAFEAELLSQFSTGIGIHQ